VSFCFSIVGVFTLFPFEPSQSPTVSPFVRSEINVLYRARSAGFRSAAFFFFTIFPIRWLLDRDFDLKVAPVLILTLGFGAFFEFQRFVSSGVLFPVLESSAGAEGLADPFSICYELVLTFSLLIILS